MSDFTGNGVPNPITPVVVPETPLAYASRMLTLWREAEAACAVRGQSYQISKTMFTAVDLPEIRKQVRYYENEVARLTKGRGRGARVRRIVPID